ncbi:hypothetical protein CLPUN_14990 [Clostridium puniceum]|uniref:Protein NO VEIN C-terminal domain-containing protein n=1 Tax=Clostridium puniceum TaxID=29367 RepID=A0A1S8TPY8_9CLOT|nr:DUF3883 domain-containing protein [Clostridium puniceum]OOM79818.1 hypothetical protein CLPUN_14990 [Clostridium puniceum]
MLTELKRCNSIGNIEGLLFLVSMLSGRKIVSLNELVNRCSLEKKIKIHCSGAVAFLQYLGYVETENRLVIITEKFNALPTDDKEGVINAFVKESISRITAEGLFDSDSTSFDADKGHLNIKRSAFPLAYAAIRNFLTTAGVLEKEVNGEISISELYEAEFSSKLRNRKEKVTLEQLMQKQAEQSQRGLEAEEFVLKLEKGRIPGKAHKIKRISDFDVSAGYDIVSFDTNDTNDSAIYNRFIEVKCYIGKSHFYWSENESDVAKRKGDKYVLCLVDYARIEEPRYEPEFIVNPYEQIFKDDTWLVNAASYKVQKI